MCRHALDARLIIRLIMIATGLDCLRLTLPLSFDTIRRPLGLIEICFLTLRPA